MDSSPRKPKGLDKCRSGPERGVYRDLESRRDSGMIMDFEYESETMKYVQPAKARVYNPDFIITRNDGHKIYVEVKGILSSMEREKFLNILNSNPDKDIRILLVRDNLLSRTSKTRYSMWCAAKGVKYAVKSIPDEWLG